MKAKTFERKFDEGKDITDALDLTKAGGLLTGAKTQQQFERYDGCIDKATRAKYYANQARAGS